MIMKYSNEININLPLDKTIELLDSAENLRHWIEGFVAYKFLQGEPGAVGSTMEQELQMGKRKFKLIETITKAEFPNAFSATYETQGVWNAVDNYFIQNLDGTTTWKSESEFKFSGMMRFMSFFMPTSMFKKQTTKHLESFKKFAENSD